MKRIFYLFIAVVFMTACVEDFDVTEQVGPIEALPGYVSFNAAGTNNSIDDESIAEGGGDVTFNIEAPTGSLSDITVNFTFSGTAVFGTDFTVAGATSAGGSVVIEHRQSAEQADINDFDNVDLVVSSLTDGVADGSKTLTITLASATGADGTSFNVGRGGTDQLRSANIDFTDIDCGFARGNYDVNGTLIVDDFGSGPYNFTEFVVATACPDETTYTIADISGGLYTNSYATAYGTSARAADIVIDQAGGAGSVTWSGVSDQFGGAIIEDAASATASNYDPGTGVITIYWTATAFGERGITTFTPNP